MFKSLENSDFNKIIIEDASVIIKKDKSKYKKINDIIETYAANNKLLFSDISLITDNEKSYPYFLYVDNPLKHTINIANMIYKDVDKYIYVKTVVYHQEFLIYHDTKPILTICGLSKYKNKNIIDLVNYLTIDNLMYIPPEIEIIDIYHQLYSPDFVGDWCDLLKNEAKIFNLFNSRIDTIIKGGRSNHKNKKNKKNKSKDKVIHYLKYLVLSDFCSEFIKNYLVVGHWAMYLSKTNSNIKKLNIVEKLQLITSREIEKTVDDLKVFLELHTQNKITFKKQQLHIPKDHRIVKYTMYITINSNKERAFIDIFNCGEYELIPYIPVTLKTDNEEILLKIGNPFVLLRFLTIDMWIMNVIHKIGSVNDDTRANKIKHIMHVMTVIKSDNFIKSNKIFGVDYIGVYKNYELSKKIMDISKQKVTNKYYPHFNKLIQSESSALASDI